MKKIAGIVLVLLSVIVTGCGGVKTKTEHIGFRNNEITIWNFRDEGSGVSEECVKIDPYVGIITCIQRQIDNAQEWLDKCAASGTVALCNDPNKKGVNVGRVVPALRDLVKRLKWCADQKVGLDYCASSEDSSGGIKP